jgi:murein L,D-transpeptidase YafK
MMKRIALATSPTLALAACQGENMSTRHPALIPPATMALMASKGMSQNDPILVRAFKKESEIEVWKRGADGMLFAGASGIRIRLMRAATCR